MLAGGCTPYELTPLHMHSLVAAWKKRATPGTVYAYALELRQILRSIAATTNQPGLDRMVPRVPYPDARTTVAAPEEIQKLLDAAPRWMQCILLLATDAALRQSDCMRVAPVHYDAEKKQIAIDQKKTGQVVTIPVTERLARILETAPTHSPTTPFYELWRGKPISVMSKSKHWIALKEKAGVNRDLWMHDLRRTTAVALYEISKDLRIVEQMLGHRSLGSTVRYLEHRDPAKLRPYLDAINKPLTGRVQ